jgi:16S rRNA (guanine1516-N2)-methyltransferase
VKKIFVQMSSGGIDKKIFSMMLKDFELIFVEQPESGPLTKNELKKKVKLLKEVCSSVDGFYYLYENEYLWELLDSDLNYISINFDKDHINYKRKTKGKQDILFKALGSKAKKVLDLSCGLAIDCVFLARNGYQVQSIERNTLVYFLIERAVEVSCDPIIQNIKFILADSKELVQDHSDILKQFDVIYFDPMYPDRDKSALSKQEMELFKDLVGSDADAKQIFELIRVSGRRIVVKRPLHGEPLGLPVRHQFKGKTVRYDIY